MTSSKNKKTLQDLAVIKDQLPLRNEPAKQLIKKKKRSTSTLIQWPKPGAKIPLQVLKFDDLEILDVQNQARYQWLFNWQETLSSALLVKELEDRIKQVGFLIEEEKSNRERSDRETDFEKILVRINKESHKLSDDEHRMRIQKEILALEDQRIRNVLINVVQADSGVWQPLYDELNQRVRLLACEVDTNTGERTKAIVTVQYAWRVRVGGLQGFRERLLPVMHPVYGIPYVPASSIKGILRSWAHTSGKECTQIKHLLGFLEGSNASMAAIEILDAFPTSPTLSLDVATPQWSWQGDDVIYGPVPHQVLSIENLSLNIGLTYTSRGNEADVKTVMDWLEQALCAKGLGSRVSAGYGQATRINGNTLQNFSSSTHPHSSEHPTPFEFWSEGIHGADAKNNAEFRPVAVRGILRYWFRAVGLGLYAPDECRLLEQELFGRLEPKPQEGSFKLISVLDSEDPGTQITPHNGTGKLILQTKKEEHLILLQALLKLAFHIGGIGRGARRPLHCNSERLRGCFWQSTVIDEQLPYDAKAWQDFLQELLTAFDQVRTVDLSALVTPQPVANPNRPRLKHSQSERAQRTQDILNRNTRIYLVSSPKLKHPKEVNNWRNEGNKYDVRGAALEFFYNSGFKGGSQGNLSVGGSLGTPSFVWIQSNKLDNSNEAYQVITLFGADNQERGKFLQAIQDSAQIKEKIEISLPW
jgi:CRISPR-associated protein Cmr6